MSSVRALEDGARPAFVVGVTGHMKLAEAEREKVSEALEMVFRWLRDGVLKTGAGEEVALGLRKTPVVLLTSMAPGADQLAAEVALGQGIRVVCPLAFPVPFYRNASTFRKGTKVDGKVVLVTAEDPKRCLPEAREQGLPVLTGEDHVRQREFDDLMKRIGKENAFHALHAEDAGKSDEELGELLAADLRDRVRRNARYRAAGEYVSAYCDLLIAVCGQVDADEEPSVDAPLPSNARSGAEQIVRSHLRGLAPGILPVGAALTWADNGPVLRIYCPRDGVPAIGKGGPGVGNIHVWHPFDSRLPGEVAEVWHARKMRALRAQAESLEALGAAWRVPRPVDGGETAVLMRGGRGSEK